MKEEEERFKYKEIETGKDKIICGFSLQEASHSEKRARKDRRDRERLIQKAEKIVEEGGSIISKRGALRYIEVKSIEYGKINKEKMDLHSSLNVKYRMYLKIYNKKTGLKSDF